MNGSMQLCKSDVCVKADGDFAKAILVILAIVAAIMVGVYVAKNL